TSVDSRLLIITHDIPDFSDIRIFSGMQRFRLDILPLLYATLTSAHEYENFNQVVCVLARNESFLKKSYVFE
ncbi:hypothetical protein PFISCL1PPCAC_16768, partial [Pristionchus fissidentatus]